MKPRPMPAMSANTRSPRQVRPLLGAAFLVAASGLLAVNPPSGYVSDTSAADDQSGCEGSGGFAWPVFQVANPVCPARFASIVGEGCSADSLTGGSATYVASFDLTINAGKTRYTKVDDFLAYSRTGATEGTAARYIVPRTLNDVMAFHHANNPLGRRAFYIQMAKPEICPELATPASLTWSQGTDADVVTAQDGTLRQVLTDDAFTNIDVIDSYNMRIRVWARAAFEPVKQNGLYSLPAANVPPLSDRTHHSDGSDLLQVVLTENFGGSSITTTQVYSQSGDTLLATTYLGTGTGGTELKSESLTYSERGSRKWDYTVDREVKTAGIQASGQYAALSVVARTREKFIDMSIDSVGGGLPGARRLVEYTTGAGDYNNERTTAYSYIDDPTNSQRHGRLQSITYPDGGWEYHEVADSLGGNTATWTSYYPWNDLTMAERAGARRVVTVIGQASMSRTSYVGNETVAQESSSFSTQGGLNVLTRSRSCGSSSYQSSVACYPESDPPLTAGRPVWQQAEDGTFTTFSYSASGSDVVVTMDNGAGSSSGVTDGVRAIRKVNRQGRVISEEQREIAGNILLSKWEATAVDASGRPTHVVHDNDPSDYEDYQYGCCGLELKRERDGSTTSWMRDALKRTTRRITKRSSGSSEVVDATAYSGLTVETTRSVSGVGGGFVVSGMQRHLNGDLLKTVSPDADNDGNAEETTYSYSADTNGTRKSNVTQPDGGTVVTAVYRDGRTKSVAGTAARPADYTYSVPTGGGATCVTMTRPVDQNGDNTMETTWQETSWSDMLGREFKTVHADNSYSLTEFHGPTAAAGSRGRVSCTKDADATAAANTGLTVNHTYDSRGRLYQQSRTVPGGSVVVSQTTYSVVASATIHGIGFGPARLTTTTILGGGGSYVASQDYESSDGLVQATSSMAGNNQSIRYRSKPNDGAWLETTINPDGTKTETAFSGGLPAQSYHRETGGTSTISGTVMVHDPLGRLRYTEDSRTGVTTCDTDNDGWADQTPAGQVLAVKDGDGRVTTFAYDKMGRRTRIDAPDTNGRDNKTYTSYHPDGAVKAVWGGNTYPVLNLYDAQGRLREMRTFQTAPAGEPAASSAGFASTFWTYHASRGWLVEKKDDLGRATTYTRTSAGRLMTRTWQRGARTRYDYRYGELAAIRHFSAAGDDNGTNAGNDGDTPDTGFTYDSFGRLNLEIRAATAVHPSVQISTAYDAVYQILKSETSVVDPDASFTLGSSGVTATSGAEPSSISRILFWKPDLLRGNVGVILQRTSLPASKFFETTLAYDAEDGRLSTLTVDSYTGTPAFGWGYEDDSEQLVHTVTGPAHTVTNQWESHRDVLDWKENKAGQTVVSKYDYSVNDIGQRESVATTGSVFTQSSGAWTWGYDALGQVVSADSPTAASDRGYLYDAIGNRRFSEVSNPQVSDPPQAATTTSYTANSLNQYSGITRPGPVSLTPQFDLDGNMTAGPLPAAPDASSTLTWDGDNNLLSATVGETTVTYTYDARGRRVIETKSGQRTYWTYEGWNPIAEHTGAVHTSGSAPTVTLQRTYVWGPDLSNTMQGAGGVGGLLAVCIHAGTSAGICYPTYDGNGNISEYLAADGTVAAHYRYDPFGNLLPPSTGSTALFRHRFSTKPVDAETGLCYYLFRYYDPLAGRWLNRDPIGERGGVNLYGFVGNGGATRIDRMGRESISPSTSESVSEIVETHDKLDTHVFTLSGNFRWMEDFVEHGATLTAEGVTEWERKVFRSYHEAFSTKLTVACDHKTGGWDLEMDSDDLHTTAEGSSAEMQLGGAKGVSLNVAVTEEYRAAAKTALKIRPCPGSGGAICSTIEGSVTFRLVRRTTWEGVLNFFGFEANKTSREISDDEVVLDKVTIAIPKRTCCKE